MRQLDVHYRAESCDSQSAAGRYNPATEAVFKFKHVRHVVTLPCGDSDLLYAYRDGNFAIFLSLNDRLEYAGVLIYDIVERQVDSELFCQGSEQLIEEVGSKGFDLVPSTIARRLYERCMSNC